MTLKILSANTVLNGRFLAVKSQVQNNDGPGELQMALLNADNLSVHKKFTGITALRDYRREVITLERNVEDEQRGAADARLDAMFSGIASNPGREGDVAALVQQEAGKKKK